MFTRVPNSLFELNISEDRVETLPQAGRAAHHEFKLIEARILRAMNEHDNVYYDTLSARGALLIRAREMFIEDVARWNSGKMSLEAFHIAMGQVMMFLNTFNEA